MAEAGGAVGISFRPMAVALLALIVLYKLGDAFAGALTTSFPARHAISSEDIGVVRALGSARPFCAFIGGGLLPRGTLPGAV